MYYDKYLKYKNKYIQLKNQVGGKEFCDKAYKNVFGTCWAVDIQTIFTFGQATSKALQEVMTSFNFYTKNKFINERIKYFQDHP